jgi:hypothetical protein
MQYEICIKVMSRSVSPHHIMIVCGGVEVKFYACLSRNPVEVSSEICGRAALLPVPFE